MSTAVEICGICEGSGLKVVMEDGRAVARECGCRVSRRVARMLERARIPKRYEHCSLDSYETKFRGADQSLWAAHMRAKKFVEGYPFETGDTGLMFVGSVGVGKTHLAVGILRELITERGVSGIFCDYRELLKQIQDSYNPNVATTELQILRPVLEAEVLLLDELGASKPTDWVWDTVAQILNTRYNERRTTIITTNFLDGAPKGSGVVPEATSSESEPDTELGKAAKAAMRDDTLGDRIGERMRSRLHEMCFKLEIYGADFRSKVKGVNVAAATKNALSKASKVDPDAILSVLRSATEALQAATNEESTRAADFDAPFQRSSVSAAESSRESSATIIPHEDKPVVGADRMGSWAAKNRRKNLLTD